MSDGRSYTSLWCWKGTIALGVCWLNSSTEGGNVLNTPVKLCEIVVIQFLSFLSTSIHEDVHSFSSVNNLCACVRYFPNFTSCLWSHRGFRIGICCSFTSYQWSSGHLFKGGPGAKDDQLQVGVGKQLWPSCKILVSVFFEKYKMNMNEWKFLQIYTNSRCQNQYKPAIVGIVTHQARWCIVRVEDKKGTPAKRGD